MSLHFASYFQLNVMYEDSDKFLSQRTIQKGKSKFKNSEQLHNIKKLK